MCLCFGCINLGPCKVTNPQQHALWKAKVLRKEPERETKNKYGAVRSNKGDSKLEVAVFDMLQILERTKKISDLQKQRKLFLSDAQIGYRADFSFINNETGKLEYCEAKGFEKDRWLDIKKLYRVYGPAPLQIWRGSYERPFLEETIKPKGVICKHCGEKQWGTE